MDTKKRKKKKNTQLWSQNVVRKKSAPLVALASPLPAAAAPTEWLAVVRANALVALDPVHNDVDGVSLALEPHYFGADVDALGAAALLAGRPPTTFLARPAELIANRLSCRRCAPAANSGTW
jgi:hypothetical protein